MQTRAFTLLFGIAYVVIGAAALIPALYSAPHLSPHVDVSTAYGNFMGVFPTNVVTDIARILIGLAGIGAGRKLDSARRFCEFIFIVMGLLTFASFIPTLNTLWGYAPIYWNVAWLSGASSLLAGYFSYVAPESTQVEPAPGYAGL